jgi:beta-lactamase family protein
VASASSGLAAAVDAYMEPLVRSHDFAGAVLVARGDRVLFERGYGLANAELGVPNSPTTVFRIASLTKTFTAAAIVMLAERGVIHYDDSIATYLPGYPNGSRITIRHLLLHAAGVANPPYEEIVTRRLTLPQLIDQFRDRPLLFAPGTESRYSNAGYVLLAAAIERASGMSYGEFIRRNITEPLGLVSTFPDPQEGLVLQRASGYVPGPPPLGLENVAWLPRRLLRRQHVRHLPNEHRGLAERAMREGRRGDGVWRAGRPGVASASDEARVDGCRPGYGSADGAECRDVFPVAAEWTSFREVGDGANGALRDAGGDRFAIRARGSVAHRPRPGCWRSVAGRVPRLGRWATGSVYPPADALTQPIAASPQREGPRSDAATRVGVGLGREGTLSSELGGLS